MRKINITSSSTIRNRGMKNGVVPFLLIFMILCCGILTGCGDVNQDLISIDELESEEIYEESDDNRVNEDKSDDKSDNKCENKPDATEDRNTEKMSAYVYVCGAVNEPDVYELPQDSHVVDGIRLAGGFTEEADANAINLAAKVADGMKIYVPIKGEEVAETDIIPEVGMPADNVKLNINTATKEQLMTLPGIGEGKASKIIQYRENNGHFSEISDIMNVNGIKNGAYEKIKELICVN